MKAIVFIAACALMLDLSACQRTALLPAGAALGGFADLDKPESYTASTLYTYMDGGADFYIDRGFSRLWVRRYGRGGESFTVELFAMKDSQAASRVYQNSRRPSAEKELSGGCLAGITPSEVETARGRYYLVARNDNPRAGQGDALTELSRKVFNGLPGPCAVAAGK
jgi:hypothetical protein